MIELIVVIVVLGIASIVVVPYLARSDTFEVQGAARAVIGDLLFAQNDAIAQQATRKVVFDPTNDRYTLTDGSDAPLAAPWLGGTYQVRFGAGSQWSSVSIDSVSFTGDTVWFDELGTPSEGGTIDVTAGGTTYRVTVTALTGRVTVAQVTGG
jgi:type II secretory pathway pseudopilin PulG